MPLETQEETDARTEGLRVKESGQRERDREIEIDRERYYYDPS
jgi:hypothetical protein